MTVQSQFRQAMQSLRHLWRPQDAISLVQCLGMLWTGSERSSFRSQAERGKDRNLMFLRVAIKSMRKKNLTLRRDLVGRTVKMRMTSTLGAKDCSIRMASRDRRRPGEEWLAGITTVLARNSPRLTECQLNCRCMLVQSETYWWGVYLNCDLRRSQSCLLALSTWHIRSAIIEGLESYIWSSQLSCMDESFSEMLVATGGLVDRSSLTWIIRPMSSLLIWINLTYYRVYSTVCKTEELRNEQDSGTLMLTGRHNKTVLTRLHDGSLGITFYGMYRTKERENSDEITWKCLNSNDQIKPFWH